jgi:hypothetical protein
MDELLIALLGGTLGIIGIFIALIANEVSKTLKDLSHNVSVLNEKMAMIVFKIENHEDRLNAVEQRK